MTNMRQNLSTRTDLMIFPYISHILNQHLPTTGCLVQSMSWKVTTFNYRAGLGSTLGFRFGCYGSWTYCSDLVFIFFFILLLLSFLNFCLEVFNVLLAKQKSTLELVYIKGQSFL